MTVQQDAIAWIEANAPRLRKVGKWVLTPAVRCPLSNGGTACPLSASLDPPKTSALPITLAEETGLPLGVAIEIVYSADAHRTGATRAALVRELVRK